jgi:hypothetical protein
MSRKYDTTKSVITLVYVYLIMLKVHVGHMLVGRKSDSIFQLPHKIYN